MRKKSGLADNPLFFGPKPIEPEVVVQSGVTVFEQASKPADSEMKGTPPPEQTNGRTPERVNTRTGEHANARTPERVNGRTGERLIIRKSYNVFEDQHNKLLRIEAEAKLSGKPVFMSDLVRQALDHFLKRYK